MDQMEGRYRDSVNMLLGKIAHMSYSMMFQEAKNLGIHPGQVPICGYLYHHDGCRQKEIGEALRIRPSTVSVSIERMEKNGLIVRKRDAMHPRIVKVYVTEKLRGCYRTFGEILEKNEKAIIHGFTEEEKEQLKVYLNRIFSNLEQESKKSGGCCRQEEV